MIGQTFVITCVQPQPVKLTHHCAGPVGSCALKGKTDNKSTPAIVYTEVEMSSGASGVVACSSGHVVTQSAS